MSAVMDVKQSRWHAISHALLLGASLLAQLWLVGLLVLALAPATLFYISALLLVAGLLLLAVLKPLCRMLFRVSAVPAWMELLAANHANALSLPKPQLYQLATPGINAFALSGIGRAGIILFHSQIIRQLTQDEIEAVIAHELAHLSARHSTVMTFLQGMAMPVVLPLALCLSLCVWMLPGKRSIRNSFINAYSVCSVLIFPLSSACIAVVSRQWEYRADAVAARLVGSHRYVATLRCLHGMFFQHPDMLSMTVMSARASRCDEWGISHPGLGRRIAALRESV